MATSAASVLAFIKSIEGNHCVIGQFTEIKGVAQIQPGGALDTIHNQTGKWIGLVGGDYYWYGQTDRAANPTFNGVAIPYWNAGGLVTLNCSMPNPTSGGASFDLSALNVAGLQTNSTFLGMLDSIAAGLQTLKNAGVVVILRMMHELNGNWFWWGTKFLSPAQAITLWRFVHDYFVNTKGLDNLLWLWSVNAGFSGMPALNRYPGDAYVDITGLDFYANDPANAQGDVNALLTLGKPTCLAEFGSGGPSAADHNFQASTLLSALKNQLSRATMVQVWWQPWGIETMQGASTLLNDSRILNRGDINLSTTPPVTPPPIVPPKPSPDQTTLLNDAVGAIIDPSGHSWALKGGKVVIDGTVDANSSNVALLALVGATVWAKNNAGLWWGKASPSSSWLPSAGTAVSPLTPVVVPPVPTVTHATVQAKIDTLSALLAAVRADLDKLTP